MRQLMWLLQALRWTLQLVHGCHTGTCEGSCVTSKRDTAACSSGTAADDPCKTSFRTSTKCQQLYCCLQARMQHSGAQTHLALQRQLATMHHFQAQSILRHAIRAPTNPPQAAHLVLRVQVRLAPQLAAHHCVQQHHNAVPRILA